MNDSTITIRDIAQAAAFTLLAYAAVFFVAAI